MKKAIIVMPFGRVGSNLVMDYIGKSIRPQAHLGNQILNINMTSMEQLDALQRFYDQDAQKAFCITKESMGPIHSPNEVEAFCLDNSIKVIRMSRRSIAKTVVSQIRAEMYAEKSRNETGTAMWGVERNHEPLPAVEIDKNRFEKLITFVEEKTTELKRHFNSAETIDIYYEDLLTDMQTALTHISHHIGFEYRDFQPRFRKATNDNLSQSVANYDELVQWCNSLEIPL